MAGCFVTKPNKIHGLPPRGRFLSAAGRNHLADDSWQQGRRVLPADYVEAFERLVDEVERVPIVGERPLGRGREQGVGERGRRLARRYRREEGAFGRLAMAHACPPPQPALEQSRLRPAFKRRTLPPRRRAVAVRRHAPCSVE